MRIPRVKAAGDLRAGTPDFQMSFSKYDSNSFLESNLVLARAGRAPPLHQKLPSNSTSYLSPNTAIFSNQLFISISKIPIYYYFLYRIANRKNIPISKIWKLFP